MKSMKIMTQQRWSLNARRKAALDRMVDDYLSKLFPSTKGIMYSAINQTWETFGKFEHTGPCGECKSIPYQAIDGAVRWLCRDCLVKMGLEW